MIKITINVPWGHGDSPHERVVKALEAMLELAKAKKAETSGELLKHAVGADLIVGSYKVEFGE